MEGHSGKPLYLIENPQLRPQLGIFVVCGMLIAFPGNKGRNNKRRRNKCRNLFVLPHRMITTPYSTFAAAYAVHMGERLFSMACNMVHSSRLLSKVNLRRPTHNCPDVLTTGRLCIGRQRIIVTCILAYKMLK